MPASGGVRDGCDIITPSLSNPDGEIMDFAGDDDVSRTKRHLRSNAEHRPRTCRPR